MTKAATLRPPLSLTPASAQNTLAMLRGSDLPVSLLLSLSRFHSHKLAPLWWGIF